MPTKRKRIARSRREHDTPEWAIRLRDHRELPEPDSAGDDAMSAWLYFGEHVPGLPDDWREKQRLKMQCKNTEDA